MLQNIQAKTFRRCGIIAKERGWSCEYSTDMIVEVSLGVCICQEKKSPKQRSAILQGQVERKRSQRGGKRIASQLSNRRGSTKRNQKVNTKQQSKRI